jgi:hypothetical protein
MLLLSAGAPDFIVDRFTHRVAQDRRRSRRAADHCLPVVRPALAQGSQEAHRAHRDRARAVHRVRATGAARTLALSGPYGADAHAEPEAREAVANRVEAGWLRDQLPACLPPERMRPRTRGEGRDAAPVPEVQHEAVAASEEQAPPVPRTAPHLREHTDHVRREPRRCRNSSGTRTRRSLPRPTRTSRPTTCSPRSICSVSGSTSSRQLRKLRSAQQRPARSELHVSYSRRRTQQERPDPPQSFLRDFRPLKWRGVRDSNYRNGNLLSGRRRTPIRRFARGCRRLRREPRSPLFFARPLNSAAVLETFWRRGSRGPGAFVASRTEFAPSPWDERLSDLGGEVQYLATSFASQSWIFMIPAVVHSSPSFLHQPTGREVRPSGQKRIIRPTKPWRRCDPWMKPARANAGLLQGRQCWYQTPATGAPVFVSAPPTTSTCGFPDASTKSVAAWL